MQPTVLKRTVVSIWPSPQVFTIEEYDTRIFRPGEHVSLRNQTEGIPELGIYRSSHFQPSSLRVYVHIVDSPGKPGRWVSWMDVGKRIYSTSPTAVSLISQSKDLPFEVTKLIAEY